MQCHPYATFCPRAIVTYLSIQARKFLQHSKDLKQFLKNRLVKGFSFQHEVCTPGPRLMRVHLVRNSTSAKFEKSPNIHLVRPIIHLVRIFALSD